jgi:hypothetical protein
MKGKLPEIQALVSTDIICLTETHLDKDVNTGELLDTAAFEVYRKDRNVHGGGVLIAIKKYIQHDFIPITHSIEAVMIIIKNGPKAQPAILACVYRPPSDIDPGFPDNLMEAISVALSNHNLPHNSIIIMVGDFNYPNIDWTNNPPTLKPKTSTKALHQNFLNTCTYHNLTQLITQPTHVLGNTLDLLLTSDSSIVENISIPPPELSDHSPITFELDMGLLSPSWTRRTLHTFPDYSKIDLETFQNFMNLLLKELKVLAGENASINAMWDLFTTSLYSALNRTVPLKTIQINKGTPWMTKKTNKSV